ncbi:MAG: D-2-hydroxyacid dehydrogenase [Betaproteobacteria bacterium]|nr:D-2-hydroxyacid dehydrogenase [Betaproteobacteria bacterium]MDH3438211.1 D-2-hydroxyacid dehydrogenase [Betaproteobacteria bacterium]
MAARKIRVHIENARNETEIFRITPALWDAACARHRGLARRLDASIGWDGDILGDALKTADIMIGVPARRDDLVQRAPHLKWVHATSAGVEGFLPLDWLPVHAAFTNNRGAHGVKAEQFMRMAYTLLHTRMPEIIAQQRDRKWRQLFTGSLAGRTALVVGLGDLGQAAARAARQLGLKVIGVSRTGKKVPHVDRSYRTAALDKLLPHADFVVMAVPLTPETNYLLDRARLDRMKRDAGVINISRAPVADYDALRDKLTRGELGGAVLDVTEPEPLPPESPLWDTPNLIITPHISCDDGERYIDITLDLWFENLGRFLNGKPLKNRVDPRRGY